MPVSVRGLTSDVGRKGLSGAKEDLPLACLSRLGSGDFRVDFFQIAKGTAAMIGQGILVKRCMSTTRT